MHNLDDRYLNWLFQQNVFPLRESTSIMSGNSKARSQLRNYLEVHSLSSDQVPFKSSVDGLLIFFFLLLNCSIVYFIYLYEQKSYPVDRTLQFL